MRKEMNCKARRNNAQSAMEYLMTYGWAILIISVVLVVLFSMGITNPLFFAPKVSPGSCQAIRPNGPRTSFDMNLAGECNNQIPSTVSTFRDSPSYVNVSDSETIEFLGKRSITLYAWVYLDSYTNDRSIIIEHLAQYYLTIDGNGYIAGYLYGVGGYYRSTGKIPLNAWTEIAMTYNGTYVAFYINGKRDSSIPASGTIQYANGVAPDQPLHFGYESTYLPRQLSGSLADIQIYNASLDQQQISALYLEGIGGVPINLQNLEGWWPLNGNANDYSGNNNDGIATNVIWSGTWWQDYSAP